MLIVHGNYSFSRTVFSLSLSLSFSLPPPLMRTVRRPYTLETGMYAPNINVLRITTTTKSDKIVINYDVTESLFPFAVLTCTFVADLCEWTEVGAVDDMDWRRHSGHTPTDHTGPSQSAHSSMAAVEISPRSFL